MQAEAIVFREKSRAILQKIEMPDPSRNEVLIRTLYSFISVGTERWALQNLFNWSTIPFPFVPGYQRVGLIEAVGPEVLGFKVGELVAATRGSWPGAIPPNWGAHASRANSPDGEVYKLAQELDPVETSAFVIAQVGYNAASRATFEPGDWLLVCGDGLIGQFAAQAAKALGARVILLGHRPERLALASAYSADEVIATPVADFAGAVKARTGGREVKAVLDSLQNEALQAEYIPLLRHGEGQIIYCGFTPEKVWADMALLQKKELTAHFVSGWNRTRLEATLELIRQGQMRVKPLITHLVDYSKGPEMYDLIYHKTEPFLGLCLDWRNI